MTLDKAIEHGKEHRKHYHGAKAVDPDCRNHGGCDWCEDNRLHNSRKRTAEIDDKIEEYSKETYVLFGKMQV